MKLRVLPALRPALLVALLALATALITGLAPSRARASGGAEDGFTLMSAAELAKVLGQKDVKVFDANSEKVFAEGHVPGAVFLAEYRTYPASTLPADKATRVIFYCKNTH